MFRSGQPRRPARRAAAKVVLNRPAPLHRPHPMRTTTAPPAAPVRTTAPSGCAPAGGGAHRAAHRMHDAHRVGAHHRTRCAPTRCGGAAGAPGHGTREGQRSRNISVCHRTLSELSGQTNEVFAVRTAPLCAQCGVTCRGLCRLMLTDPCPPSWGWVGDPSPCRVFGRLHIVDARTGDMCVTPRRDQDPVEDEALWGARGGSRPVCLSRTASVCRAVAAFPNDQFAPVASL